MSCSARMRQPMVSCSASSLALPSSFMCLRSAGMTSDHQTSRAQSYRPHASAGIEPMTDGSVRGRRDWNHAVLAHRFRHARWIRRATGVDLAGYVAEILRAHHGRRDERELLGRLAAVVPPGMTL